MARLSPAIERRGPAWGQAWEGTTWLLRRFVDPEGFRAFRATLRTTAKSYLISRYLGIDALDYYSCTLVDLFGNFSWLGFLLGAVVCGAAFRFYRGTMTRPASGAAIVVGLFVVTSVLSFDQEAASLLFGWFRRVPLLLIVLALRPFRVVPAS